MLSSAFTLPTLERLVKTFLQTFVAVTTVSGVFDLANIDWKATLVASASAAVLSLLTSILSSGVSPNGSPSLVEDPNANLGK